MLLEALTAPPYEQMRREFAFTTLLQALRQLKDGTGSGKWVTRLD
ncbi:hypothetical protein ACI2KG_27830 [Pseudomonas sp. NPDC089407]